MKKILCILLLIIMGCSLIINVQASEHYDNSIQIIYLDNGDYVIIEITETLTRSISGKSGSKAYTYYDRNDVAQWRFVLSANFTYTGNGSACTSASSDVAIYDSNWYLISKSADRSGNTATGTVTMGCNILGITFNQDTINLTLSCDVNGNLS